MRLSKKAEYALRALAELAMADQEDGNLHAQELSRRVQIPVKFLEQILLILKRAGILQSRRGAGGGYVLSRPPDRISVGEIVRLIDGPVLLLDCAVPVLQPACPCGQEDTCGLRDVMGEVRQSLSELLDRLTLADICRRTRELRRRREFVPLYSI
ncbi:MAG: Rrf2 family transcriptional regulator [Candidatus Latescibacterota bacterium]